MWKWIEFSYHVLGKLLATLVILIIVSILATLVTFLIVNLVQVLFW